MLNFELLKLLAKTNSSPAWTMVWNRWYLEIFSTSNYFMLLGSITTAAPIPECRSDASGSQVAPGTWRLHQGLGQPYRWCPSKDTQEIMTYPSRHLSKSSRRGCSCYHGWGSLCCLEGPPKQLPSPRQTSRNPGFFHHLRRAMVTRDRRRCFFVFKPPFRPLKGSPFSDTHWVVEKPELSLTPVLSWPQ